MMRTEFPHCWSEGFKPWARALVLAFLGAAGFGAQTLQATESLYFNDQVILYPGNTEYPPVVDATNFVNTGTMVLNDMSYSIAQPYYETLGTLNYTNTGTMMANTGFRFSTQSPATGFRSTAASFNNSGMVSCGSTDNTGDVFSGFLYYYYLGYGYYPQCLVAATNIAVSGTINVGYGGLIQLAGENVDLTRSTLWVETTSYYSNRTANVSGNGISGLNTNSWYPAAALSASNAYSASFPLAPYSLWLTNSTAYFDTVSNGSNNVIRAVFIQDDSGANVSYNVYFGATGFDLGGGYATIEWVGSYDDPATGGSYQNYLYLQNNYMRSVSTNVFLINGIPDNFTFTASATPLLTGEIPTPAGFNNVFSNVAVTNRYSFADARLTGSTVGLEDNPTYSPTNLIGRIEISATNELDLSKAQITGANFLSVQAPRQLKSYAGALLEAAYSSFNLGATNGFMTISNLISPSLPNWSGTVQAWSTQWLGTNGAGATNDYRVLIVRSSLSPIAQAQVQDLVLNATNSLMISDTFHIMRRFSSDAENITLTTNQYGEGASSLAGELNIDALTYSWSDSVPNLRNLTNNGAIRVPAFMKFAATSRATLITPATNAVAAGGQLSDALTNRSSLSKKLNVENKSKVQIGTNMYLFVKSLNNKQPNQVKIDKQFAGTMSNLIAAINGDAGAGKKYSKGTLPHPDVVANVWSNNAFTIAARLSGPQGNAILTLTTSTNLTWNGYTFLHGGTTNISSVTNVVATEIPYDNLINHGEITNKGSLVRARYFEHGGRISSGGAYFSLQSLTTLMTNASIEAGDYISLTANSLIASNVLLQAGQSLSLSVTNLLTDTGVTNGNVWLVQSDNGSSTYGLVMKVKPVGGDLLGTTISNNASGVNKQTQNIWAGADRGAANAGYTNNSAVGRLILNAFGANSQFRFTGATVSNALYLDYLELTGYATNFDGLGNLKALTIDPNITIYFAQAIINGDSVAEKLDGKNGGRLRWVPSYAGYYSSTNLIYGGYTNTVNAALAISSTIDSDGDGIPNSSDPTPFPVPSPAPVLSVSLVSVPPVVSSYPKTVVPKSVLPEPSQMSLCLQWIAAGGQTYQIYYCTNLQSGIWLPYVNFSGYYYGDSIWVPNTGQTSTIMPPVEAGSSTTVRVFDVLTASPQFYYQVRKE